MLREISSSQLTEWEEFLASEPMTMDAASVCAEIWNSAGKTIVKAPPLTAVDFLPGVKRRDAQSPKELSDAISAAFQAVT